MTLVRGDIDIFDPDWYVTGDVHGTFAELRRDDPVHFQEIPEGNGYWAVLRHADVIHVARHPEIFSASLGGVVLDDLEPDRAVRMRRMLLSMDPPQHRSYRQPLTPHFGPRVIGHMEEQIRERCKVILETAVEQGDVDFCHDVAAPLPAQIIAQIMGLPQEDTPRIQRWAEIQTSGSDEDVVGDFQGDASLEMAMYGVALAKERRAGPRREDITGLILESTFEDGSQMGDTEFGSFFSQLVTAGNDTTKTMMSLGTYELICHPEAMAALGADHSLIPTAVEEMLRFCNPLHYFRRTATEDTSLGGATIEAGDKVAMIYTSANRDEAVFADPQTFDVRRSPNPHLSFGAGGHFCLGAHLARLEAKVFFEELLGTMGTIELTGEPARIRSNLNNGFKHMPVRLAR